VGKKRPGRPEKTKSRSSANRGRIHVKWGGGWGEGLGEKEKNRGERDHISTEAKKKGQKTRATSSKLFLSPTSYTPFEKEGEKERGFMNQNSGKEPGGRMASILIIEQSTQGKEDREQGRTKYVLQKGIHSERIG